MNEAEMDVPVAESATPAGQIDLSSREGLAYLKALVDTAPRLSGRTDMPVDPLTEWWRSALLKLIELAVSRAGT